MRILLDTPILLWWLNDDANLTQETEKYIVSAENEIYISTVSTWEIAIKQSIGRLEVDLREFEEAIGKSGLTTLSITMPHTLAIADLPMHHTDPFDRLLVAQSKVEPLRLLTHDKKLELYGDNIILV